MEVERYVTYNGNFPEHINSVLNKEYVVIGEMFKFDGMKFKIFYEYNHYANGYVLVIDSWSPPNIIYIFNEKRVDFNSDLYSVRGL